ncbi:polysaccharide biosynthesis protein [Zwartia vadi]|uniref:polysaccharide biosynthesis protein n=1 Tax=Zwartia vadi TaxID=3058168 RepID=UPI0025B4D12A|nr:nucleoside-diphosphate sugar epimerase/dehydratase [Zwartia vadi]MDN3987415.1 nucleoside-diphosphate sugar epimerase/dehydratase [Zwartia vadi]
MAFYLRLDVFVPISGAILWPMLGAVVVALPIFITSGLYRAIFRYSGLPAMVAVVRAMLLYGVVFAAVFTFYGVPGVPRTVGLIQPLLLLIFVGASRALARIWLGSLYHQKIQKMSLPQVIIYGAGGAGRQLASAMANSFEMRVVGFLDDDDRLHGNVLNGLPIYNPADLSEVLANVPVTDVLLALPSISRRRRNDILEELSRHKLAVRTLPVLSDIATGKVSVSDLRELDIDDLLGREPVQPNHLLMIKNLQDKVVLVTGAGGSIGSELCRQILKVGPAKLLLIEQSEFALYAIHQELGEKAAALSAVTSAETTVSGATVLVPLLASTQDEVRMRDIMSTWRPDTVYHSAAYKHVPLVEHNPAEGIKNNVFGTLRTAQAAAEMGVTDFVLISTDKAVRPTNMMGASKRLAEMALQALAAKGAVTQSTTKFSIVRFGNVLGSSGSVVPRFRQQIRDGGPVTLTHADITRYFMTIPEAAQLVIQAGAMAKGGDVFVLDMGEPVKIIDLAKRLIELSGLTLRNEQKPDGDIAIETVGLRPGEKLYEELLIGENPESTSHPRIIKAREDFLSWAELEPKLEALNLALRTDDVGAMRSMMEQLVRGYAPGSEIIDWVFMENRSKQIV